MLKSELSALLLSLLESKESESIINGLNIMGALCGFGTDFGKTKVQVSEKQSFFRRNSLLIPITVWEKVFAFQESWDITIQIASILILQIALPAEYGKYIYKKRKQRVKMSQDIMKSQDSAPKPKSKASMATECVDKDYPATASLHGALGLAPQEGGRQLDTLLKALHSVSLGAHGSSKTAVHESNGAEKANYSVTAISGDQQSEDAMSMEFNWLEKRFEEQELRQLLNLFKMNFSKEENKWNRLEFSEKHLEIVFEKDKTAPSGKQGYTDEIEKTEEAPRPLAQELAREEQAGPSEAAKEAPQPETDPTASVARDAPQRPAPETKPQAPVGPTNPGSKPGEAAAPQEPAPASLDSPQKREKKYHFGKKIKVANTSVDEIVIRVPSGKKQEAGDRLTKDKSDSMRRNSTRKEISRILSTHLVKSPLDSTMRHTVSPKNGQMDVNYIANLIRHTVTSNSRPRIMSRQGDKNCSAGSLVEKKEKPAAVSQLDQLKSLGKKQHETVLSNLKKKIFSKAGGDIKKGISNEQLHKQSLVSIINKATENKFKSTALLRPSRQGVKSAKIESLE